MNRQFLVVALVYLFTHASVIAQDVDWQTDLETAKSMAAKQDKLVLLHFSATWCRPCKNLEKFVFNSPAVARTIQEQTIPVHIDTDLHPDLVKQYEITEIPTDVMITAAGEIVQKRKSPKIADNYVRMVNSIHKAVAQSKNGDAEKQQKMDRILNPGITDIANALQSNDFSVVKQEPTPVGHKPSTLRPGTKSTSQTKLVDHETTEPGNQPENISSNLPTQPREIIAPQRVINDQFFVEKSNAADEKTFRDTSMVQVETSVGNTNDFRGAENSSKNPTRQLKPAARSNNVMSASTANPNAAKILTPNFGAEQTRTLQTEATIVKTDANQQIVASANILAVAKGIESRPNVKVTATTENDNPSNVFGLNGKCPVTLIKDGKWATGDEEFGCTHRGRTYLFSSKEKLQQFLTAPESFSPILAGYDPVIFHKTGELVDGKEKHGVFMGTAPEHRIVLFHSKKTRAKFQADPQQFMATIRTATKQSDKLR